MGLTSPLPAGLAQECRKCSQILRAFVDPVNGLDKLIPSDVLRSAHGFAILTLVKAGFVFSARAGTGVVIARLPNGSWSAPCAIGTGGVGFGGQAGAELTEFIIVLNSKSAVRSFMSAGSVTLGGNLSVAVGPLGRNAEGTGSLNSKGKVAAMYSYSRTKGLFGGVSIEGSIIVERQDANAKAYGHDVTAKQLLSGAVEAPPFADALMQSITQCAGSEIDPKWIDDAPSSRDFNGRSRGYSFGSPYAAQGSDTPTASQRDNEFDSAFGRGSPTRSRDPFADSRSSPTWRARDDSRESDHDEDDEDQPRASIDTINDDREDEERIWQPRPTPPAPSPKLKKPLFGKNRSRSSSTASASRGFNPPYSPALDDAYATGRQTPPPSTKSRMSPFNRSRSSSSASKLATTSDFVVPPAVHHQRSSPPPERRSSPRFPSFSGGSSSSSPTTTRHKSKGSLDVANDSYIKMNDDLMGFGAPADSLRAHTRAPSDDLADDFGRLRTTTTTTDRPAEANRARSGSFQFAGAETRLATSHIGTPKPAFLTTDTRKASFGAGEGQAIALYDFDGTEDGDLSFKRNDVITIVKRMAGQEWWTGRIGMREGIFPLNRVEIIDVPKSSSPVNRRV